MEFVVLSSSRGTTFQSTIDRLAGGSLSATCRGLVTDREDRGCIAKAEAANLPHRIVRRERGMDRASFDERIDAAIQSLTTDSRQVIVTCMGWMFVFSEMFVREYRNRILNVHPALLPKHGGKGMYGHHVHEAVLRSGDTESGITIHQIDEGVDTGPILLQKRCPVLPGDCPETLQARVQELEKEWYPQLLQMIHDGRIPLLQKVADSLSARTEKQA